MRPNNYPKIPTVRGLCSTCYANKKNNCFLFEQLVEWRRIQDEYGGELEKIPEDVYDNYGVDEPEFKDGQVIWCPEHYEEKVK